MIDILLAVPDIDGEADLVAVAPACGLRILRRCVDAIDLYAAAATDPGPTVVISAGLPRLGPDLVDRLGTSRSGPVIGLVDDPAGADRLRVLGVEAVVSTGATAQDTARSLLSAVTGEGAGVWPTRIWESTDPVPASEAAQHAGRLVAVWGPAGAPGRTTVAVGLAESIADSGRSVCLVDGDTYGPSIALALGLIEESSGLVVACRLADNGTLSAPAVRSAGIRVRGTWYVLGGIGRPDRWPELRPGALDRVWEACRAAFDVTVVDVGFCLEDDSSGAWSHRRNATAISALSAADDVVAVAQSSALGAARLAAAWPIVVESVPFGRLRVVENRAPGRARRRREGWGRAVVDLGVVAPQHVVPDDERAARACWGAARSLREGARRSALRRSLSDVAAAVMSG